MLKLVQKTKLQSAENGLRARELLASPRASSRTTQNRVQVSEKFEEFLQSLSDVDFNNRSEESKFK